LYPSEYGLATAPGFYFLFLLQKRIFGISGTGFYGPDANQQCPPTAGNWLEPGQTAD